MWGLLCTAIANCESTLRLSQRKHRAAEKSCRPYAASRAHARRRIAGAQSRPLFALGHRRSFLAARPSERATRLARIRMAWRRTGFAQNRLANRCCAVVACAGGRGDRSGHTAEVGSRRKNRVIERIYMEKRKKK